MGISQSKFVKYDTPVYYQMKKHYGQKCMQDIEKLIKHHDFPEEGTLSLTKLKVVSTNQVVVANVLNMYVKNVNKQ